MPRFAVLWATLAGCVFDASYAGGHYTCSDGKCPSGLTCSPTHECVAPGHDASIDATHDAAPIAALTCADPGAAGATQQGSTAGRTSTISSSCGGTIMNGPDAVYRVTTVAGDHLDVGITGSYPVDAYVISPCAPAPAIPLCEGNVFAAAGTPIALTPPAGVHFVIVDGINAVTTGTYTLTVTVTP